VLGEPRFPTDRIELVWHGVDHAEGLAIAEDGTVWCGGEDGQVYRGRLDGKPEQVASVPGRTLGFALDAAGNAYCAVYEDPGLFRITPEGRVDLLSTGTPERPAALPNHPAFMPGGELLYTDSGTWRGADGCIYAVAADGTTSIADTTACHFPNGLCVSPDGATLAVVETTLPGVTALSIGPDGSLGERRVLLETPFAVPEGVAYDVQGRLLVSSWAPDAIYVLEPSGELWLLAHDPYRLSLHEPTNVAFVPGTSTVVAANYGERFLSVLEHDTVGAPLPRPAFDRQP
jgi:sugar lactone lactonase YvrE